MQNIVLYSVQPVMAAGFNTLLDDNFILSAVESTADELIHRVSVSHPSLVVVEMTAAISLEFLRGLITLAPQARVILWVDSISTEFASQAIGLGVSGILRRNLSAEIHLRCLIEVAAGQLWVDVDLSRNLLCSQQIHLTPRERQLMGLLAQGLKNKEIAWSLGITEGTVKVYLSRLFDKVGANDRFELALMALKNLSPDHTSASQMVPQMQGDRAVPFMIPSFVSTGRTHLNT
jgi:DNA-binding NarL/FixJ family response regulator